MSKSKAHREPQDVQLPVIKLALDRILVDEGKNLRRFNPDAKSVEELALDIKENKMINPVLVKVFVPVEGDTRDFDYELVAGFQRMKAVAWLNDNGNAISEVSASLVTVEGGDVRTSKLLNLKENLRRTDISYIDYAYAIKDLQDTGMSNTEIAKEFKKSGAWVSYVSKLLTLRAAIQKKIHDGTINWRLARTLPDLDEAEQDTAIADMEAGQKGSNVASKAKAKKGRKSNRGRKSKEDSSEGKNLSSKQAILQIEELYKGLEETEGKKTKADEWAIDLYKTIAKYLSGGMGVKALHNRVMKAL